MRMRSILSAVALAACVLTLSQTVGPSAAQAQPALQKAPVDADGRPLSYPLVDRPMPAFSAEKVGGGRVTQDDLKGQWTVIEFWGVWCGDCQHDAEYTAAFARAAEADGVRFVTVHVDSRSGRWPSVAAYLAEKQITYPVLMDPDRTIYRAFQMQWVPTYLVVDSQGVIRGYRTDLSRDPSPEGGVKAFSQQIAELRRAQRR
jgi:peroxiredoxin